MSPAMETKIVNQLCSVIQTGNLSSEELTCCILALGWICDQREQASEIEMDVIYKVLSVIRNVGDYYSPFVTMRCEKPREVAVKMVNGDLLNVDEEQFLLTKLEL